MMDQEGSFRDHLAIVTDEGKRRWIYAWKPSGKFYNARTVLSFFYLIIFFSLPFVRINGNPALLIDMVEGKFSILGMIFWPQDFFIFGVGMVTFIVFIYLFTMIFGRLFCGWACPQTVFLEMVFRKIEWMVEGNPNKQKALNNGPWTSRKIALKTLKHCLFFVLSFFIANTFLAYIIGSEDLLVIMKEPVSKHLIGFFSILIFTFVFYAVFAFVREIVCTIICPYGRLQSVLLDQNSIVVAYNYNRGEPRGKGKRPSTNDMGDCVDCNQCVVVCPTGIDIRNGTQLECINCTACIDACDSVMKKVGLPPQLITYASENQLKHNKPFVFDNRMKVYAAILALLMVAMGFLLTTRKDVEVTILRAKGSLFQEVGTDSLSNLYNVMFVNKTNREIRIHLEVKEPAGNLNIVGGHQMTTPPGGQSESTFFVVIPKTAIQQRDTKIKLGVYEGDKLLRTIKTSFLGYTE